MKKFYSQIIMFMVMSFGLFGCLGSTANVAYHSAMMTTASASIYQQFDQINVIVAEKLPEFDPVDQQAIIRISNKFRDVKLDIDGESGNGENIGKIMIRFSEYLDLYYTIEIDYLSAKEILMRNSDKFNEAEIALLQSFDRYAVMLHTQVTELEASITAGTLEKGYDVTSIMQTTGAVVKAFATIAVLL